MGGDINWRNFLNKERTETLKGGSEFEEKKEEASGDRRREESLRDFKKRKGVGG